MPKLPKNAFTLVELLVVISIISILSVIGLVVFTNIQKSARDSKRKADIDSISKAYEAKYSTGGQYQKLSDDDFGSGKIPISPEGSIYQYVSGPDAPGPTLSGFLVCAALDGFSGQCNGSPSQTTCFCRRSTQGSTTDGPGGDTGGGNEVATCPSIPGLAGYWKMDEGAGNTASDSSGGGNSVSLKNGVAWDLGKVYGAVKLDGSDDFLESNQVFDVTTTTSWTISAWIRPQGTSGGSTIAAISTNPQNYIYLHRIENGLGWRVVRNGGEISRKRAAGSFVADNWYHIVLAYQSGVPDVAAYVNGNQLGPRSQQAYDSPPNVSSKTWFGRIFTPDVSMFYSGLLDEFRIYTRALDFSEVNALYNSGAGCTN